MSRGELHTMLTPYYAGTCLYPDGEIYLNEVLFVENRIVKKRSTDSYTLTKLVKDSVEIEKVSNRGQTLSDVRLNVRDAVLERNNLQDIKIELQFIVLDGEVAIYWKDASATNKYRQGVFKLRDGRLECYCQGKGGFGAIE